MYVQLSIGRATGAGTTLNYDEWRHFIGNAQTLVKGFLQTLANEGTTILDPEVHLGVGQWVASGREESAHISAYVNDDLIALVTTPQVNGFISKVSGLAFNHWQDAICVTVVQKTRGINTLAYSGEYDAEYEFAGIPGFVNTDQD